MSCDRRCEQRLTTLANSGIFGYINYLVEKDRKYILNTLVNGTWLRGCACNSQRQPAPRSTYSGQLLTTAIDRSCTSRVPRLRLGWSGSRRRQEERGLRRQGGGQGRRAEEARRRAELRPEQGLRLTRRHCPHPMGHPRPSLARQLPPPQVCASPSQLVARRVARSSCNC